MSFTDREGGSIDVPFFTKIREKANCKAVFPGCLLAVSRTCPTMKLGFSQLHALLKQGRETAAVVDHKTASNEAKTSKMIDDN